MTRCFCCAESRIISIDFQGLTQHFIGSCAHLGMSGVSLRVMQSALVRSFGVLRQSAGGGMTRDRALRTPEAIVRERHVKQIRSASLRESPNKTAGPFRSPAVVDC